jgi:chloramphenicol 3-O phosphotransferase
LPDWTCCGSRSGATALSPSAAISPGETESRAWREQAEIVHQGVDYDLEVDTTHTEALACGEIIAARVG